MCQYYGINDDLISLPKLPETLKYLKGSNNPYLLYLDTNYNTNIKHLISLQRHFKKILNLKTIQKRSFVETYYSPHSKGGFIAKRDLLNFLTTI